MDFWSPNCWGSGYPMVIPWFSHGSPMVLPMFFKRTATAHGAHHVRAPGAVLCDAHLQRGTLSTGSHRLNRWIFLGVVERSLRSMDFIYFHIWYSMLMYVIYHPRTELGVKSLKTCELNLCTTYKWAALWTVSDSGPAFGGEVMRSWKSCGISLPSARHVD